MTEAIINVSQIFERTLTNNQGDFVTGATITYEVRNSSTNALLDSGTMTEQDEVYKFSYTFTSLIEARVKFTTPNNFSNDLESVRVVVAPANATDITNLTTEINENETKIDNLDADLISVETNLTTEINANETKIDNLDADLISVETNLTNEINANETKIDALPDAFDIADQVWDEQLSEHTGSGSAGSTGEALDDADATADPSAIADAVWDEAIADHLSIGSTGKTLDDIENKTTNLPTDPASETNVNANETKIDSIITTLSTLVSDVWSYVTRTLTGIGSSGISSETNATTNTNNIITEIDANEVKIDGIVTDITAHRNAVEDKIKFILGLTQHNTQIKDTLYDGNSNLTSAIINIYDTATDAQNDTNVVKSYQMTATYNTENEMQTYIVKEL